MSDPRPRSASDGGAAGEGGSYGSSEGNSYGSTFTDDYDAALTAAAAPFVFQLRFAKPATKSGAPRWTPFHEVRDLVPAVKALKRYNDWDALKRNDPWVRQSDTVRVLEIGAQIVFAGLPIEFIAPPVSLAAVFDPTCECRKDLTYTIWAGVDFEVKMPDGRVFSKREFLKEVLKADMA